MKVIKIGNRVVDEKNRPFIVAEVGVNHENDMNLAKRMIDEVALAGADAVKFQTYKAGKIASKYSPAYWNTDITQYDYFRNYDKFGEAEYRELAEHAEDKNITFMSTPFDFEAVDFLDKLVPVFKISSSDITNIPFIKYIARKRKPIFLSSGASTIEEIREAVNAIEEEGNDKIAILHCILSYPTRYDDANLHMIAHIQNEFPDYLIGLSDHTLPDKNMLVLTTAFLLGAKIIEKHYTYDKTLDGNDHYHAMDFEDLKTFIENIDLIEKMMGERKKKPIEAEIPARKFARRSIVAKEDISEGSIITDNMVTFKRPGTGISPKFLEFVIGRKANRDIKNDEILKWEDIEGQYHA